MIFKIGWNIVVNSFSKYTILLAECSRWRRVFMTFVVCHVMSIVYAINIIITTILFLLITTIIVCESTTRIMCASIASWRIVYNTTVVMATIAVCGNSSRGIYLGMGPGVCTGRRWSTGPWLIVWLIIENLIRPVENLTGLIYI